MFAHGIRDIAEQAQFSTCSSRTETRWADYAGKSLDLAYSYVEVNDDEKHGKGALSLSNL